MDAVEYLKSFNRLCNAMDKNCNSCPLGRNCVRDYQNVSSPIANVKYVEAWAKRNPSKTRQSEFLKLFPDARMTNGALKIFPCAIDSSYEEHTGECVGKDCGQCRKEYWLEEIE